MDSVCSSFDRHQIEEQWGNVHDESYRTILGIFLAEAEDLCLHLRSAMAGGQRQAALRHLHTLRGAAANVGAARLATAAAALEQAITAAGHESAGDTTAPGIDDLDLARLATRAEIEAGGP